VPPRPTKASIARETELLAQVQRALQTGRPATALAKLNQYNAEFPSGMLHEESIASRVMALCAFGRDKDAERWTAEFFLRYPNSPLSARVRGACRTVAPPTLGASSRSK
jgi:outer membrane protein assembly factor BamD (BamD/ComL family)